MVEFLQALNAPASEDELCAALAVPAPDLATCVSESERLRCRTVGHSVVVVFLSALVAPRAERRAAPSQRTTTVVSKRGRSGDSKAAVLAELRRKRQMIEKHTSESSREGSELVRLTAKWRDVAEQALEDLKRLTGSDKTLGELCVQMEVDARLLGLADDDDEN